jgi:hypothetical protein
MYGYKVKRQRKTVPFCKHGLKFFDVKKRLKVKGPDLELDEKQSPEESAYSTARLYGNQ